MKKSPSIGGGICFIVYLTKWARDKNYKIEVSYIKCMIFSHKQATCLAQISRNLKINQSN
jgi:hypothetical protein